MMNEKYKKKKKKKLLNNYKVNYVILVVCI